MTDRERRLTTIVAIDVAASSRLMHADETGTLDRLRAARAVTDPIATAHGARIVGTWGDGLLVEFPSVVQAVEFARKAQAAMVGFNKETPEDRQLLYRIGINLGDVIVEDDDLFGDGVNVAARLEALAPPGGIVLSRAAHDQVRDKMAVEFEDLGEVEVKNIARPVRAFRVLREGEVAVVPPKPGRRWPVLAAVAGLLLALLAGGGYWYMQRPQFTPADPAKMAYALDERPSIAVLAFDNLTGDPEQEHVSDGISEDIISSLARLPGLLVIARNSSFFYKGKPADIRQIAEEMSVRYVLEGSLQSFGETIRITAQLIDAVSGHHVWTERFDRPRADFFKVRDQITDRIVRELNIEIVAGGGYDNRADLFESFDTWLIGAKARWHGSRFNAADNRIAIDLIEKIRSREPDSVWVYENLAWSHSRDSRFRWSDDPAASLRLAESYAEKAVALDDQHPGGYLALCWIRNIQNRNEEAIAFGNRALELAPSAPIVLALLAFVYQKDMQVKRATDLFERAIRVDRNAPAWVWENYGEALVIAGRHRDALAIYQKALETARGLPAAETHLGLAIVYDALGQNERARAEIDAAIGIAPRFSVSFLREYQRYKDQDYKERWLATLKRLGLPEE